MHFMAVVKRTLAETHADNQRWIHSNSCSNIQVNQQFLISKCRRLHPIYSRPCGAEGVVPVLTCATGQGMTNTNTAAHKITTTLFLSTVTIPDGTVALRSTFHISICVLSVEPAPSDCLVTHVYFIDPP